MGLRRLLGLGGDDGDPPEIDTRIATFAPQPGQRIEGEVLLRGGSAGLKVEGLYLHVVGKVLGWNGSVEDREWAYLSPSRSYLDVAPGTEERIGFHGRLPWDCPITEVDGRTVGVDLSLTTTLSSGPQRSVRDIDLVHVAAPPLHEAVLSALRVEGHRVADAQLLDSSIPEVDLRHSWIQTFHLEDGTGVPSSEVTFVNNPVGAMVYVRRAARHLTRWDEKPPAVPFPVAHHETGEVDLGPRVREALDQLDRLRY
ncbi:sporulation protein [Kitasatospora cineracea]|uniref:Sporulation-control protein spo0M n=1 Tax=Kitasatospora cineracea TaxID=88074 RepID=A0A3N4SEL7_9ACTN|nr:sporulation protein [Kitasatospora cineracea]RPE37080.1 sporulation-control protein spo0M [Kitasatospora cineracea]